MANTFARYNFWLVTKTTRIALRNPGQSTRQSTLKFTEEIGDNPILYVVLHMACCVYPRFKYILREVHFARQRAGKMALFKKISWYIPRLPLFRSSCVFVDSLNNARRSMSSLWSAHGCRQIYDAREWMSTVQSRMRIAVSNQADEPNLMESFKIDWYIFPSKQSNMESFSRNILFVLVATR